MTSGSPALKRSLAPWPTYGKEVHVKEPAAGEDPLAVAGRERAGRVQANRIISKLREWYQQNRSSLAQPPKVR